MARPPQRRTASGSSQTVVIEAKRRMADIAHLDGSLRELMGILEPYDLGSDVYIPRVVHSDDGTEADLLAIRGDCLVIVNVGTDFFESRAESERVCISSIPRHRIRELTVEAQPWRARYDRPVEIRHLEATLVIDGLEESVKVTPNRRAYNVGSDQVAEKVLWPFVRRLQQWLDDEPADKK